MSEALHIHEGDEHIGVACRPSNLRYQAAARPRGGRKYEAIGKPSRSKRVAMRRLADFLSERPHYDYSGGVWFYEAGETYYDPSMICEVRQR